jgi:hypothetical protein
MLGAEEEGHSDMQRSVWRQPQLPVIHRMKTWGSFQSPSSILEADGEGKAGTGHEKKVALYDHPVRREG